MIAEKGTLFIISAPSGTGKSSLIRKLLKKRDNTIFSISYTTRPRRKNETEGKDYFFIDENKFNQMVKKDMFLEYAKVHNYFYGTSKQFIFDNLNNGMDIILDIDVQGAKLVKKNISGTDYHVITIFIMPPSYNELKSRLEKRGTDSKETINTRLKNSIVELEESLFYDYVIINDVFQQAFFDLLAIFRSNSLKPYKLKLKIETIINQFKEEFNGKSYN